MDPADRHRNDLADVVERELERARSGGDDDPAKVSDPLSGTRADAGEVQWYESGLRNLEGALDGERPRED